MFKNSNNLRLYDINRLQVGCFVYQAFHGHLPESFNNYSVTNQSIHGHLTRQHNDMHQLLCYSSVRASSIKIYDVQIWNSIPDTIRTLTSIHLFKGKFKLSIQYEFIKI